MIRVYGQVFLFLYMDGCFLWSSNICSIYHPWILGKLFGDSFYLTWDWWWSDESHLWEDNRWFLPMSGLRLGLIFWYTMTIDPYFDATNTVWEKVIHHPWICDSSIIGKIPKNILLAVWWWCNPMVQVGLTPPPRIPVTTRTRTITVHLCRIGNPKTKSSFVTSILGWGGRSMVHSVKKSPTYHQNVGKLCHWPSHGSHHFFFSKHLKMDGLQWKTLLLKWMIWGYHYFWKPPYRWRSIISSYPNPIQLPPIIRPRSIRHFRRWSGAFEHLTFGLFNGSFFLHMGKHLEGAEKTPKRDRRKTKGLQS